MKTFTHLKQIVLVAFCCFSSLAIAQTSVTSDNFKSTFEAMKVGGGGSIILTEDVVISLGAGETYSLSSTVGNVININTQEFKIVASGTGTTADNAILEIGSNVNIEGTATVLTNLNRGKISIVGGSVKSVTTVNGASTLLGNAGWVYISGGTVSMEATGVANAYAVNQQNNFTIELTGGTISAVGDNTRALNLMDGVTPNLAISNVTISATGAGAYGIQSLGGNKLVIGNNVSVTTSSTDNSDVGLFSNGTTSSIVIPSSSTGVSISSSAKFMASATGTIIDYRGLTLSANPLSGAAFTDPTDVTLTASGNESATLGAFKIYYNIGAAPTSTSSTVANGGKVTANQATTKIIASIGEPNANNTVTYTFTYTVQNASGPKLITSYADLKTAYTASQSASAGTTTEMKLMGNIVVNDNFSMVPDAQHPVTIDPNGFQFQINAGTNKEQAVTFGGKLTLSGTGNAQGTIRIYGPGNGAAITVGNIFNITGGTYSTTGAFPIIYAGSGGVVNPNTTKIFLSDAVFTTSGTGVTKIVQFQTADGNLISAKNCTFNVGGANSIAFDLAGPKFINIEDCIINMNTTGASGVVFKQAPSGYPSTLTIDGLELAMNTAQGKIFEAGSTKDVSIVIKDMVNSGDAAVIKPTTGTGVKKLYDFRGFEITALPTSGSYDNPQMVTMSLPATVTPDPMDAAGATIRYTIDESAPTATSQVHASAITVNTGLTINAVVEKDGFISKAFAFVYDYTTGIDFSTDNEPAIYISDNTLYLPEANQEIQIYNINGQLILDATVQDRTLDVSSLNKGVYLVKVGGLATKLAK